MSPDVAGPTERALADPGPGRLHALDALRAAMMLLGILLHGGLSYSHMPPNPAWPFKDARSSYVCDAVMLASGLFRMPVFFLIAGLFGASSLRRHGIGGFWRNRTRRVLIPFVAAWLLAFPIVRAGFIWSEARASGRQDPRSAVMGAVRSGGILAGPYPIHLWFLEYLLIYYGVATLAVVLSSERVEASRRRLASGAGRPMRLLIFPAILTAIPLAAAPVGVIPTPLSFVPEPVSLASYLVFFGLGWLLDRRRDLLAGLARHPLRRMALALALIPLSGMALFVRSRTMPRGAFGPLPPGAEASLAFGPALDLHPPWRMIVAASSSIVLALLGSSTIWLLTLGVVGLFLRHFRRPANGIRGLSDASYWLYLAHFPLMVWLPILLADLALPALAKLFLTLLLAMPPMVYSYRAWIRGTTFGVWIAGEARVRGTGA